MASLITAWLQMTPTDRAEQYKAPGLGKTDSQYLLVFLIQSFCHTAGGAMTCHLHTMVLDGDIRIKGGLPKYLILREVGEAW